MLLLIVLLWMMLSLLHFIHVQVYLRIPRSGIAGSKGKYKYAFIIWVDMTLKYLLTYNSPPFHFASNFVEEIYGVVDILDFLLIASPSY